MLCALLLPSGVLDFHVCHAEQVLEFLHSGLGLWLGLVNANLLPEVDAVLVPGLGRGPSPLRLILLEAHIKRVAPAHRRIHLPAQILAEGIGARRLRSEPGLKLLLLGRHVKLLVHVRGHRVHHVVLWDLVRSECVWLLLLRLLAADCHV